MEIMLSLRFQHTGFSIPMIVVSCLNDVSVKEGLRPSKRTVDHTLNLVIRVDTFKRLFFPPGLFGTQQGEVPSFKLYVIRQ